VIDPEADEAEDAAPDITAIVTTVPDADETVEDEPVITPRRPRVPLA
jgi:hypothetical protein